MVQKKTLNGLEYSDCCYITDGSEYDVIAILLLSFTQSHKILICGAMCLDIMTKFNSQNIFTIKTTSYVIDGIQNGGRIKMPKYKQRVFSNTFCISGILN